MGYTHYFNFDGNKAASEIHDGARKFTNAVELVKRGLKKMNEKFPQIELAGADGKGKAYIYPDLIAFNGKGSEGCESMWVPFHEPLKSWEKFCKTCERPYDLAVCITILCLKKCFGDSFSYSSDGMEDKEWGWVEAHKIMDEMRIRTNKQNRSISI